MAGRRQARHCDRGRRGAGCRSGDRSCHGTRRAAAVPRCHSSGDRRGSTQPERAGDERQVVARFARNGARLLLGRLRRGRCDGAAGSGAAGDRCRRPTCCDGARHHDGRVDLPQADTAPAAEPAPVADHSVTVTLAAQPRPSPFGAPRPSRPIRPRSLAGSRVCLQPATGRRTTATSTGPVCRRWPSLSSSPWIL
jgi:hypothetical protein